jgi:hypothetical protein
MQYTFWLLVLFGSLFLLLVYLLFFGAVVVAMMISALKGSDTDKKG